MSEVTIIGGGLAGLVAAISVAEGGGRVTLYEAAKELGGRARSKEGPYRANRGGHALYLGGELEGWLRERELMPAGVAPAFLGFRFVQDGRLCRVPRGLLPVLRTRKRSAPADLDYRSWASAQMGERAAHTAIGAASLPTFHSDPGRLSAAFVHERMQRSLARPAVVYVRNGWQRLVDALDARARELGVTIELGCKLNARPDGPTIVATDLPTARRLLDDPTLDWPGPRTATLDLGLSTHRRDPSAVLDLDGHAYVSRYSSVDPTLAPEGEQLIQGVAGIDDDARVEHGVARLEAVLDHGFPGWRDRVTWRRQALYDGGAGAADPVGTTWRDRPAVARGDDLWLAGDRVAAPGILSEVSVSSARQAARGALAAIGREPLRTVA